MDTQRTAWNALQPSLTYKQNIVLDVIRTSPSTLFEISAKLDWPINRVSGRVTELRKAGKIVDSAKRRTNPDSGKSGVVWEILESTNNGEDLPPCYNEDGRGER